MSYHDLAGWSQIVAMVIFGAVMAGVLVYALRPGNKKKFDAAAKLPLTRDEDRPDEKNGRPNILRDEDEEGQSNGRT